MKDHQDVLSSKLFALACGLALGALACCSGAETAPAARRPRCLVLFSPALDLQPETRRVLLAGAIARKEWNKALDLAEQILRDGRPIGLGDEVLDPPTFLIHALEGISGDFLDAYRKRFEGRAAEARRSGRYSDWAAAFYGAGMETIGNNLALEALDRGDSDRALEIWRTLLLYYPDPVSPRDLLVARACWAASLSGNEPALSGLPEPEGEFIIGGERRTGSEMKRFALGRCRLAGEVEPVLLTTGSMAFGRVSVEQEVAGEMWRVMVRSADRRVDLFSCDCVLRSLVGVLVWKSGEALNWVSTEGVAGVVDLESLTPHWSGPLNRFPGQVSGRLRERLRAERIARHARLEEWAEVRKPLLSNWHYCDQNERNSDLLATSFGAFWVCPCGQITPMSQSGIRSASYPDFRSLPLSEEFRENLSRIYAGSE